ncbi:MAG: S9 family peptidase, partial [Acidobacteria bacterium]
MALVFAGTVGGGAPRDNGITYPEAPRLDLTDEHHGVKVPDPYRWLEQTDSEQTRKWIEAQNKIAYAYLEKIPKRQAIKDRLTDLWNFERYGIPH